MPEYRMHAEVAGAIAQLQLAIAEHGGPQPVDEPSAPPRRSRSGSHRERYLEEAVEVACTDGECSGGYTIGFSRRGDLASLSAKAIKRHDERFHPDDPVDPALIAWAKDELRAGDWSALAGRYHFVLPDRIPEEI